MKEGNPGASRSRPQRDVDLRSTGELPPGSIAEIVKSVMQQLEDKKKEERRTKDRKRRGSRRRHRYWRVSRASRTSSGDGDSDAVDPERGGWDSRSDEATWDSRPSTWTRSQSRSRSRYRTGHRTSARHRKESTRAHKQRKTLRADRKRRRRKAQEKGKEKEKAKADARWGPQPSKQQHPRDTRGTIAENKQRGKRGRTPELQTGKEQMERESKVSK